MRNELTSETLPTPQQETTTSVSEMHPQASDTLSSDGKAHGEDSEPTPVSPTVEAASTIAVSGSTKMLLAALKPHPINETIYGSVLDDVFVKSVERNGIFHPLLVTHDNRIISGNRRYAAAKKLGMTEVAVVYFQSDDELDIETALVEANRQREKSNEQIGREFNLLVEVEAKRAALRMATNKKDPGGKPLTQAEHGKARDLAAGKIGEISGVSAQRAGKVVEAIDKLSKKKHKKKSDELRETLNRNIEKAHKLAIELGELPAPAAKKTQGAKASPATKVPVVVPTTTPGTSEEQTRTTTPQPPSTPGVAEVLKHESFVAEGGGQDDEGHYKALEAADAIVTFFRSRESTKLTASQKHDWKKVGDQISTFLMKLGIKISAS